MTDNLVKLISEKFPLKKIDVGEFSSLKVNGMTFETEAFDGENFGRVSVMRAKGFFGLMKTDTVILSPVFIDLPLYSYDRIKAFGKDVVIVELYDTIENKFEESNLLQIKNEFSFLKDKDAGKHEYDDIKLQSSFYKTGKKKQEGIFDDLEMKYLSSYLNSAFVKTDDVIKKCGKITEYVNGLLRHGGPSTDVFVKAFGKEKTEKLYKKVLFGVK